MMRAAEVTFSWRCSAGSSHTLYSVNVGIPAAVRMLPITRLVSRVESAIKRTSVTVLIIIKKIKTFSIQQRIRSQLTCKSYNNEMKTTKRPLKSNSIE